MGQGWLARGGAKKMKKPLDKTPFVWYIVVMKRDTREMLELVGIIVGAAMAVPVAIFVLVMLLSL